MEQSDKSKKGKWIWLMAGIMVLQFCAASYFCMQKQGFHYDEYYSYYSSNVTYGLVPTDREWKDTAEISSEFKVLEDERFRYNLVKTMQSYDVHPPLYYMILHTVCSLFPGVFSKWFGLGLNLCFFLISFCLLAVLADEIFKGNKGMTALTCLLYGFGTGVLSGITFIRMYMLLTVWCLLVTVWHIKVWKEGLKVSPLRALLLGILVMFGFLTHYYFAVFMFFAAAYTCLYHWLIKKDLKHTICYGMTVCAGMAAAVLWYPACLSHIFRGYRGTEAAEAFFDVKNTIVRLEFFTDLMNQSVFGGCLPVLVLFLLLLSVSAAFFIRGREGRKKLSDFWRENQGICMIAFITFGYFMVVAKTALLNAEEANRYELPVYGFWTLLVLAAFYYLGKALYTEIKRRIEKRKAEGAANLLFAAAVGLAGMVLLCQFSALVQGKVQFLYPEDRENVLWAKENSQKTVLYLYNPANVWMIWDESEELMQYDKIYFVSLADTSPITDEILLGEDEIYVYASRMEEAEKVMEKLRQDNPGLQKKEKIRELLYCDLFLLQ